MFGLHKIKHPHKTALMEHAEGLVGSHARLTPVVVAHVAICAKCQAQVDEMKASIRLIDNLDTVTPSDNFTATVMMAARQEKRRHRAVLSFLKTGTVAASLALFAAVVPTYVMQPEQLNSLDAVEQTVADITHADVFSLPRSSVATPEETLLAPVVLSPRRSPSSDWERAQHRALEAYDTDIAEAELALANNRALTRASMLIDQSRERKARTLKEVYTESR